MEPFYEAMVKNMSTIDIFCSVGTYYVVLLDGGDKGDILGFRYD